MLSEALARSMIPSLSRTGGICDHSSNHINANKSYNDILFAGSVGIGFVKHQEASDPNKKGGSELKNKLGFGGSWPNETV
mmetsp:Transcript_26432/g.55831  ORF Transcript_26432/g.55831 Transcript_26432/m.55831 type:complete len:80 (-) Transcript_26432:371-610(-)